MKTIVTGASGLLGREVFRVFKEQFTETVGTCFSRDNGVLHKIDLTDSKAVYDFVKSTRPDVIVHCAAERKPDVCSGNPEQAEELNVSATRQLSELSDEFNFKLVYISTDYVFDGTKAPYSTDDQPNPINFYGKTKLAGEKEVLKARQGVVVRVPILYGPTNNLNESAVTTLADKIESTDSIDNWAVRYPTLTTDIAKALVQISQKAESGIYHFSSSESFTKYEMTQIMAKLLNKPFSATPANEPLQDGAVRPYDCHLDTSKLQELGLDFKTEKFQQSIMKIFSE